LIGGITSGVHSNEIGLRRSEFIHVSNRGEGFFLTIGGVDMVEDGNPYIHNKHRNFPEAESVDPPMSLGPNNSPELKFILRTMFL
jgi:hypothetical protein